MLIVVLQSYILSEWYFWVQSAKMVSVDNDFSCEATANTGNSFCCDILLIFQGWGMAYSEIPKSHQFCRKRGLRIICLIVQKILSPLIF